MLSIYLLDTFSFPLDSECFDLSVERNTSFASAFAGSCASSRCTSLYLHVPVCDGKNTSYHPQESRCTNARLPLRSRPFQTSNHVQDMQPRQTSSIQTLWFLRSLCCEMRSSLPLGQQLLGKRQLSILPWSSFKYRRFGDIRRVSKLLAASPIPQDQPRTQSLLSGPLRQPRPYLRSCGR